jgi:hypothetical protein
MARSKARVEKFESAYEARMEIRKNLALSFPELGSENELDNIYNEIAHSLEHLSGTLQDVPCGAVRDSLKGHVDQDLYRLKAIAKQKIEILKRELALNLHGQEAPRPAVNVNTGGGRQSSTSVRSGGIYSR